MIFEATVFLDQAGDLLHRAILRNEATKVVLFDLCVVADTIEDWLQGLRDIDWSPVELRQCVAQLKQSRFRRGGPTATFWRIAFALRQILDAESISASEDDEDPRAALDAWLERNFAVSAYPYYEQGKHTYRYSVRVAGSIVLQDEYLLETIADNRARDTFVREVWWTAALHKVPPDVRVDTVQAILSHFDILQQSTIHQTSSAPDHEPIIRQSFAELAKALIADLDQVDELALLRTRIPDLCVVIIDSPYDSFENQKPYLERMLNSPEAPQPKSERLRTLASSLQHAPDRLTAIVGPISAYYLNQYNLNEAAHFWQPLAGRHRFLAFVLALYRRPGRFAVGALAYFVGLWVLVGLQKYATCPTWRYAATLGLAAWMAVLLLPVAATLVYIAARFIARRGVDYVEMLLPRLFGAIVVGSSVLLLQDTAWRIGLLLPWLNLAVLCLIVYTLSYLYIYIDVYKTTRLLPNPLGATGGLVSRAFA